MTPNPFEVGGALLSNTLTYIERKADKDIRYHLYQMNYVTLIEPRQQGKTSLINRLIGELGASQDNPDRPYWFAVIDFSALRGTDEKQGYTVLGQSILTDLAFMLKDTKPSLPVNNITWLAFLTELATIAGQKRAKLIIALDEIGSSPHNWATDFFAAIRSIHSSRQTRPIFRDITFILSGAYNPRTLIKDPAISPFNIAHRITISDFTIPQIKILTAYLSEDPTVQTQLASRIYHWTGGQPYLTHWLCSALVDQPLTTQAIDIAVNRLRREDNNHLPHVFEALDKNKKLKKYVTRIASGFQPHFEPIVNHQHRALALIGIIKEDEKGKCQIRNRIYKDILNSEGDMDDTPLSSQPHQLYLKQRLEELQSPLKTYNQRIKAIQKDIARTLDSEAKIVLEERLVEANQDREKILAEIESIEQQLANSMDT